MAIFSTSEQGIYEQALMVNTDTSHIIPFERDKLFLSIYDACRHRPTAVSDAAALTDTVLGSLVSNHLADGKVARSIISKTTATILQRFDPVAQVHYVAFHPF